MKLLSSLLLELRTELHAPQSFSPKSVAVVQPECQIVSLVVSEFAGRLLVTRSCSDASSRTFSSYNPLASGRILSWILPTAVGAVGWSSESYPLRKP